MHFILSDNDNYNFDVKVGCCEFVGFVNDVIDCGYLGCVFCFRIKEKDTFYINFYFIIFLQSCCFFPRYFYWIIIMDMCILWFNVSKLFIYHTYTQNSLHFNLQFSPLVLLPLYIYLSITFHVIPCQIYIGQKRCYLPSFFSRHLLNSNIVVSSNPNPYELTTTRKRGLHFILSDNSDYKFDFKVERCKFVGFVNDVIDCGCLRCVFCFRIKEK